MAKETEDVFTEEEIDKLEDSLSAQSSTQPTSRKPKPDSRINVSAVHPAMAYSAWGFLCLFCGLALAVMGYLIYGFVGSLVLFGGAAFAGTMAWFPTQGSARAKGATGFQIWCLVLVIASGSVTAFCTATAISMLTRQWNQEELAKRNQKRVDKLGEVATNSRKGGLNSKGAATVSGQAAQLLGEDAKIEREAITSEEPEAEWYKEFKLKWIRYAEWFNGIGVLAGMSLLYILYHKQLDRNGNGKPDYMEGEEGKG